MVILLWLEKLRIQLKILWDFNFTCYFHMYWNKDWLNSYKTYGLRWNVKLRE